MKSEVLHIGVSGRGTTRTLTLTGELDAYTSTRLTDVSQTWTHGAKKVVVNLDRLEYIDSAGLSALVKMWVNTIDAGAQMLISCRNPRIHRVLEITGLLNLFNVDSGVSKPALQRGAEKRQEISPPRRLVPETKSLSPPDTIPRRY